MSKLVGDKQSQTVSDGSFAVQVHGNITYSGLSYNDVKDICVDMMRANFLFYARMRANSQWNTLNNSVKNFSKE